MSQIFVMLNKDPVGIIACFEHSLNDCANFLSVLPCRERFLPNGIRS